MICHLWWLYPGSVDSLASRPRPRKIYKIWLFCALSCRRSRENSKAPTCSRKTDVNSVNLGEVGSEIDCYSCIVAGHAREGWWQVGVRLVKDKFCLRSLSLSLSRSLSLSLSLPLSLSLSLSLFVSLSLSICIYTYIYIYTHLSLSLLLTS